jgi:hypothetical protein
MSHRPSLDAEQELGERLGVNGVSTADCLRVA